MKLTTHNGQTTNREAELADKLVDLSRALQAPGGRLTRSEWEVLDSLTKSHRAMPTSARVLVGWLWLPVVGVLSLVGLLWIYPQAESIGSKGGAPTPVEWWGPDFTASLTTATLLAMAFAALAGCIVQACIVFSMRSGKHTLERGYEAWYFLRPFASALLAVLVGLAAQAGLFVVTSESPDSTRLSLPTMVAVGALAGLFTDRVIQRMQNILGATDPDKAASSQTTPGTPDTTDARDKSMDASGIAP
jgi:hypothetical protein